jgi:hypothetical protein
MKILDVEVECAWTPHTSGVGGLITFLSSDGITTGSGTKACCELYGYVWNSGNSKCYAQNGVALPTVVKPQEAPGDVDIVSMVEQPFVNITASYTVGDFDKTILADAVSGLVVVSIPQASRNPGRVITVKRLNSGANSVRIDTVSPETIDGSATNTLSSQYARITIQSNGNNWFIVD